MPKRDAQHAQATKKAAEHIYENVEAVFALYEKAEDSLPSHQRQIERLAAALGRPRFLYAYMLGVAGWISANGIAPSFGAQPLDAPPFFWLQGFVAANALLVTIIILIAQNRQSQLAERRAHLDLQVNLLSERKITKVIALLEELRRDMPSVKDRYDDVAEAMTRPADPQMVVRALDDKIKEKP